MMPPIRCFTCGALIGDKFEEFYKKISAGKKPGAALDELGIKRYCCRRMLLTHYDVSDEIIQY
ncbi:MAG: DNA-directed RNA polymerase subunit N [Candidatus Micrarchaeia archaeon]